MGCHWSKEGGDSKEVKPRSVQPKAPILLFYLPSNVRDTLTKLIASHLITSETATNADRLNVRFIDIPNQRSTRRFWQKELTNRTDYAIALYVADIRDRSQLLLNVRTLNWFLKLINTKSLFNIVVICSNDIQLAEFKRLISLDPLEILIVLSESKPESVFTFVEVISAAVQRYNDNKHRSADITMRGTK